jgi:predicted RNA binding protein YcfA (HicA-like mRNA interferase family)
MPHFGPIKRRELVACLRRLGYSGPYAGGRHEFMLRDSASVTIPNPHGSDIGPNLLAAKCCAKPASRETSGKPFEVSSANRLKG